MAKVDIAYKEPHVLIDSRLQFVDGNHSHNVINPLSALERIAQDCRVIIDNPQLWEKQAEEMLRRYNEELRKYDEDEEEQVQLEDTYVNSIQVEVMGKGVYTENVFEYSVILEQKGVEDSDLDTCGGDLFPTLTSQDIDDYLSKPKRLPRGGK